MLKRGSPIPENILVMDKTKSYANPDYANIRTDCRPREPDTIAMMKNILYGKIQHLAEDLRNRTRAFYSNSMMMPRIILKSLGIVAVRCTIRIQNIGKHSLLGFKCKTWVYK
jgi:hypothetical protein